MAHAHSAGFSSWTRPCWERRIRNTAIDTGLPWTREDSYNVRDIHYNSSRAASGASWLALTIIDTATLNRLWDIVGQWTEQI
eukprot:794145-Prorocentrum_lima.AAC.1